MSSQYWVIAQDGQAYGPAEETTLATWATEGRLTALSTLQDATTNQRLTAGQVPSLARLFGLRTPTAVAPQQPQGYQQPQTYQQPQAWQPQHAGAPVATTPHPATYQQPTGYQQQQTALPAAMPWPGTPAAAALSASSGAHPAAHPQPPLGYANPYSVGHHQLGSFPIAGTVILQIVTFGLFPAIHFLLMHDKLPRRRADDPSAGKAIGFLFIPFFNLYWYFFAWLRLMDRLNEERQLAAMPPTAPKAMFLIASILMIIPVINYLSFLIFMPLFVGMMQSSVNELVRTTRGPAA